MDCGGSGYKARRAGLGLPNDGTEPSPWRLDEDPIVIPGDRLANYLDQDAARFQQYGALDLTAGKYTSLDGKGFATARVRY